MLCMMIHPSHLLKVLLLVSHKEDAYGEGGTVWKRDEAVMAIYVIGQVRKRWRQRRVMKVAH